jgi:D-lactate dehydrogenase (cytochrome)
LIEQLRRILSNDRVSTNDTVRANHSKDESYHTPSLPDVVVFPQHAEEVSELMKFAQANRIPIIPFGLGTSLEGHVIPYHGGISVDFSLMNKVLEVQKDNFLVKVQPGVTRTQLNKELKKHGLFFTVDPGADATIGGMAATNASGTTSVRYGIMRDQVRDLEVVLADGTIIHTGGAAAKSSSGYHITGVFVGSEGTLGLFTELTLRVYGIPESIIAGRATIPTLDDAVDAVISILSAGISIARCELVDARSIKQVNLHSKTSYREAPTLFLEFHGNAAGLQQDVEFTKELVQGHDCYGIDFESDNLARTQLWEARHNLAYAFIHGYPGKKLMVTDVCLPISELSGAINHTRSLLNESDVIGAVVGHVGDGNFHTILMIDPNDPKDHQLAEAINGEIVEYAISRGGTCTGEHGVGVGKLKYQAKEHGAAYAVMAAIKQALDPQGILNPGKIFSK